MYQREGQGTSALKWAEEMIQTGFKTSPKSIMRLFKYTEEWVMEVSNLWHEMQLQVPISASTVFCTNKRGGATTPTSVTGPIYFFQSVF